MSMLFPETLTNQLPIAQTVTNQLPIAEYVIDQFKRNIFSIFSARV